MRKFTMLVVGLLTLAMAGCGANTSTAVPTPTVQPVPTFTNTPEAGGTPVVSDEDKEAAPGLGSPEEQPTITPTPEGGEWVLYSPDFIIEEFVFRGVEVGLVNNLTREAYGTAPLLARQGRRFIIPSLGPDRGGLVMSFSTVEDRDEMRAYYDELGRSSPALYSHTMVEGNILVVLDGGLAEEQVADYREALERIR